MPGSDAAWFAGHNDPFIPLWDPSTGAAQEALMASGVHPGQGMESCLAFVGTLHAVETVGAWS